jgi:hypothetical protein
MSRYVLEFLWPNAANTVDESVRVLDSDDLAVAKFEAALMFAGFFRGPPPSAYRLLQNGDLEVYRYPEHFH